MESQPLKKALLFCSIHGFQDPRIVYKIAPTIAPHYQLFLAMTGKPNSLIKNSIHTISLPFFKLLLFRLLITIPIGIYKTIRIRPDIVHIFSPELIPVAFIYKWLGAQIIYEVQENLYLKFNHKTYNNSSIFQLFFRKFDHLARCHFQCIFTDEGYLKEYNQLAYPPIFIKNYHYFPNTSQLIEQQRRSFIYAGVISKERSIKELLEAFQIVQNRYKDITLEIFGTIPDPEVLNKLNISLNTPHINWHGYQPIPIIEKYSQKAIAGIALLYPIGDYPISIPCKFFDYLGTATPIITSNFALYQDFINQTRSGLCIAPDNVNEITKTLFYFIEHPEIRKQMGENGYFAVLKNYNWNTEGQKLLDLYLLMSEMKNKLDKSNNK